MRLRDLLPILLLGACSPVPPAHVAAPPVVPVPPAAAASPSLESGIGLHSRADGQSSVTAERVKTLSDQLKQAEAESGSAVAALDKLRREKFSVESDLENFYNRLVAQEKAAKAMTLQVRSVEASLAEERQLREQATAKLKESEGLVRGKEEEASGLRMQLDTSIRNQTAAEEAVQTIHREASDARTAADRLSGENRLKNKLLAGCAGLILLMGVFIYLLISRRTLFPF